MSEAGECQAQSECVLVRVGARDDERRAREGGAGQAEPKALVLRGTKGDVVGVCGVGSLLIALLDGVVFGLVTRVLLKELDERAEFFEDRPRYFVPRQYLMCHCARHLHLGLAPRVKNV